MVDAQATDFIKDVVNSTMQQPQQRPEWLKVPKRGKYTTLGGIANELLLCRLDVQQSSNEDHVQRLANARLASYLKALDAGKLKPGAVVKVQGHTMDEGLRVVTEFTPTQIVGRRLRVIVTDALLEKMTWPEIDARLRKEDALSGKLYVINGQICVDTGRDRCSRAIAIKRVGTPDEQISGLKCDTFKLVDVRTLA